MAYLLKFEKVLEILHYFTFANQIFSFFSSFTNKPLHSIPSAFSIWEKNIMS